MTRYWMPTQKWWTSTVTGLGTLLVVWLSAPGYAGWTRAETTIAIGFVVQRLVAYLTPNASTADDGEPDG